MNLSRNIWERVIWITYIDLLEVPAFRKNKKVSQFFQPVKELSERFPKEKFIETTKDYDKVVHEISKDYVKFLNDYDTVNNFLI